MDCIHIRELEVFANHGVYEEENRLGQLFIISADLKTDTWKAGISDDLKFSVDYGSVCHLIEKEMKTRTFHLIEAVAQHLASAILKNFPLVEAVTLTVDKPWASIGLHVKTAGVTVTRSRHHAWIAIGSNQGNSGEIILGALKHLEAIEDIHIVQVSDMITTKPYGVTDQPDFINGCFEIETTKGPEELLDTLLYVEKLFGRERKVHWGPRTLDLDIVFYDHDVISTPRLSVPHPDMANRTFVLGPLTQIAGWYMHPLLNQTVEQLYKKLTMGE